MTGSKQCWQIAVIVLMAALVLVVAPTNGAASSASFTIIQPSDALAQTGKTYGEWSVAWWQYALSIPVDDNPLLDPTGAQCRVGQGGSSSVFFLVGTFGGTATRDECKAPAGKALFFPLLNVISYPSTPGDNEHNLRMRNESVIQSTTALHANIDGVDVGTIVSLDRHTTPLRTVSPGHFFEINLPANNLLGLAPGTYPAVADGFYLMVAPLPPGSHTINFGGTSGSFALDVTYTLK